MALWQKIWRHLAGLNLSIWLLILSSLTMLLNSHLASRWPEVYHSLNTTPLWAWLWQTRTGSPWAFMAVLLLIAFLAAFALNILACTVSRLGELLRAKGNGGTAKTFVAWAPTLMHILFFLILAGHMATFCLGRWRTHVVRQGDALCFSSAHPHLKILGFSRRTRAVEGPLQGSVVSHEVEVQWEGRKEVIRELQPMHLPNGDWLLFLPPQQKQGNRSAPQEEPVDCSGEERHVKPIAFDNRQPIMLKQVSDPGVYFLFGGFALVVVLMGLHYAIRWK